MAGPPERSRPEAVWPGRFCLCPSWTHLFLTVFPPLAGGPADHGPVLLTENLHLIVFPHADLLQKLLGDPDAEAAVGPLDHVEVGHGWSLLLYQYA